MTLKLRTCHFYDFTIALDGPTDERTDTLVDSYEGAGWILDTRLIDAATRGQSSLTTI